MPTHPNSPMISMQQAADLLPKPPSRATMYRWCTKGVNGVRLISFKVGAQRVTTVKHFLQFIAEMSGIDIPVATGQPTAQSSSIFPPGFGSVFGGMPPIARVPGTPNNGEYQPDDRDEEDDSKYRNAPRDDKEFENDFADPR